MRHLWGFDLSMSAVRLMRREAGYWREIASEAIDGPDIEDRLNAMIAQIGSSDPVHIFLPRDQILYTDVVVSGEDEAADEIRSAMEGRTPYALGDLEIDWELTDPGTARVAAIAHETLDEALAFADQRGLKVAEFSSFAEPEDFPRLPDFGARLPVDDTPADEPTVTFASTREPVSPPPEAPRADTDPVVVVDDATPVMQVETSATAPVPLGAPLPRVTSEPRILTDIAANADDRARGDSLAPIAANSAQPVSRKGIAIAAALTLAIGAIVWSVLPDREVDAGLAPSEEPAVAAAPSPPLDEETVAEAPTPPAEEIVAETPAAPIDPLADAPQPTPLAEPATLAEAPDPSASQPLLPATRPAPALQEATALTGLPTPDAARPAIQQLLPTPEAVAAAAEVEPGLDSAGGADAVETLDDVYLASIELPDLATDAIALPAADDLVVDQSLQVPAPPDALAPPEVAEAEQDAEQDTTASAIEEAVLAALDPVIEPEPTPEAEAPETVAAPADQQPDAPAPAEPENVLPTPTDLAASVPDNRPRNRPGGFTQEIERDKYGGRTLTELQTIRPSNRPQSAQALALAARSETGTAGDAVESSALPRRRPQDFDALVATAILQQQQSQQQALLDFQTPDTSAAIEAALADEIEDAAQEATRPQNSPRLAIPPASGANVARQATVEDAIRLNRINLVGVYGVPSDRRALVRLPSGRYVKVKVGDRVDGGRVSAISESELRYEKGSRTFALTMPSS